MIRDRQYYIKRLGLVQRTLCDYDGMGFRSNPGPPSEFCDCKYGLNSPDKLDGEENGCCEMRQIVWMLERMTDEEFERFNI